MGPTVLGLLALASPAALPTEPPVTVLIAAPGYPGSTKEAAPLLEALGASLAAGAKIPKEQLSVVYEPTEKGGLERLARPETAMAIVPLPFLRAHGADNKLEPRLQVEMAKTGATETWTLVAKKGRVKGPEALAGFKIMSIAGYAPAFVRGVLADFGRIPDSVEVVESAQVLSALRSAASGKDVAVLLDGAQAASFDTLPMAAALEIVARSRALPVAFVVDVTGRLPSGRSAALREAFVKLSSTPEGKSTLEAIRVARFFPLDDGARAAASGR